MGSENRYHDKESSGVAKKYDKIKAENKAKKEAKEKERIAKYVTPYKRKDNSFTLQNEMHKLLFDIPEHQRDHNWQQKWKNVVELMKEIGIYDGFEQKFQLARRGLNR